MFTVVRIIVNTRRQAKTSLRTSNDFKEVLIAYAAAE